MLNFELKPGKQFLSQEEIYDILPVKDLADLQKKDCALCLVWNPSWERNPVSLSQIRGTWQTPEGKVYKSSIYYAQDSAEAQVTTKNRLDHALETPYLFVPWKKSGLRAFRIILKGKAVGEYSTLNEALRELIPGHFIPEAEYCRKHSLATLLLLEARKRRNYGILCRQVLELLNDLKQREGGLAPGKPHDG